MILTRIHHVQRPLCRSGVLVLALSPKLLVSGHSIVHKLFLTKTFIVEKDHWLNQPNPIYGLIMYGVLGFFSLFRYRWIASLQFYITLLANFGTIYLGYILYFVLKVTVTLGSIQYITNIFNITVSMCGMCLHLWHQSPIVSSVLGQMPCPQKPEVIPTKVM